MSKPKSIEWFAGLYEGEGCISYSNRALSLYLGSNDEDVLKEIVKVTGVGKVRRKKPSLNPNHKQQYIWDLSKRNEVLDLIEKIIPYLGKRRIYQIKNTIKGLKKLPERRLLKVIFKSCGYVKPTDITTRGAKKHLEVSEKPCPDCATANRNYLRKWRKTFFKSNP